MGLVLESPTARVGLKAEEDESDNGALETEADDATMIDSQNLQESDDDADRFGSLVREDSGCCLNRWHSRALQTLFSASGESAVMLRRAPCCEYDVSSKLLTARILYTRLPYTSDGSRV